MNRKQFVLLGTAGLAAVAIPSAWYFFGNIEYDPKLAEPALLAQIWDDKTIADIGKKYRKQTEGEGREPTLVRKLLANVKDEKTAIATLKQETSNDFIAANTVMVDGWILSITEARQCALFSILHEKSKK